MDFSHPIRLANVTAASSTAVFASAHRLGRVVTGSLVAWSPA